MTRIDDGLRERGCHVHGCGDPGSIVLMLSICPGHREEWRMNGELTAPDDDPWYFWIPTAEELPPIGKDVYVLNHDDQPEEMYRVDDGRTDGFWEWCALDHNRYAATSHTLWFPKLLMPVRKPKAPAP